MEQAGGYRRLMEEFSLTQEEVAARVGRSRPAVANTLRLLSLPKTIQDMVQEGALSEGHGRALVGLDESVSLPLALQACEQGLSVRQLERLASAAAKAGREGESPRARARKRPLCPAARGGAFGPSGPQGAASSRRQKGREFEIEVL